jgi:uncharacterized protein (DUF2141 family)
LNKHLLIIAASLVALPAAAQAGNVDVALTGVHAGGKLYVSLQPKEEFMAPTSTMSKTIPAPKAGTISVSFADVKPGEYAVVVWHDDNDNGRFDVQEGTGIPTDGWAMINADQLRGMPTFDQVKTTIGSEGAKITLPVQYPPPGTTAQ